MLINVRYFAMLRESAGVEQESITFNGSTYSELYEQISNKHGFTIPGSMIQVAVNDEFTTLDQVVSPNSNVIFIPPVAGG